MTERKPEGGRKVTHNRTRFTAPWPHWTDRAACKGMDTSLWFPISPHDPSIQKAKDICARCPVASECLQWAYDTVSWDGIYGGMTGPERRNALRNERRRKNGTEVASA